ncbi:MAG TPA: arginine--tRNA ligase [Ignavibacteria bacterium]|nr:arginine--tRNA ligase [Ignavibacteria bacterium]HMR40825.1 arginine--tRNA ligase [Ignavibacteria bacterium]
MKKHLNKILTETFEKLNYPLKDFQFDNTKDPKFGDFSTNAAMLLAKDLKLQPREIAGEIISNLRYDSELISKVEIAGPGFINFFVNENYYKQNLLNIISELDQYGRSEININKTADLEWVSANPTGPLHLGHGRGLCLGKSIANLLEWTGYRITREYYYNDAGNQMNNLAKSVHARYMQLTDPDYPFPEDGYVGDYVKKIAQIIFDERKDSLKDSDDMDLFKKAGENYNFKQIRKTLDSLGVHHDIFFNETSLYENKSIEKILKEFKDKDLSYEKDGAVWLKMGSGIDPEKDKVIVKATGEPTYRLPDIAYHIDKINRGFDLIIDILGSDHGDTHKEVLYGVKLLGFDQERIKVIIHQMVTFKIGDETVKMSKRSDNALYLDDLVNDIGADATQFFFIMRGINTHLDFDIKLAKEQSEKNPMYYLQYAHARICGILRNADDNIPEYKTTDLKDSDLSLLSTPEETDLLKTLSRFPEEVINSAASFEPHKIITYLNETAESFHRFYHNNRVVDKDNIQLSVLRLKICLAVRQVLKNGFSIIGISAPERM